MAVENLNGSEAEAADESVAPRLTLEEYIQYLKAPQWLRDGYSSYDEYENDLCSKVKEWYRDSEEAFKEEKGIWEVCFKALSESNKRAISSGTIFDEAVAAAKIPILKNTMLDQISALYSGQFNPVGKSISKEAQPMVALANRFLSVELKLNQWDTLKFELGQDGFVCDIWIVKIYTDNRNKGPFGEKERIVLRRIEPRNCFPDPKATRWDWNEMTYFIVQESVEIGTARRRFPEKAAIIDEALAEPDGMRDRKKWSGVQLMTLPGQRKSWGGDSKRERIQIKECWLHDERMKFVANKFMNPETGEFETEVDEEGYVVGFLEPAYPAGRMVVTASDRVILEDIPNPYWHDGLPFEFCLMGPPGEKLFTVGEAAALLGIDRKINDVESRCQSYLQSEIERPMQTQPGALPTNSAWYGIRGSSKNILVINDGKTFMRPAPQELPQSVPLYLARLQGYRDETAGQPGILKGQIADGSQIGANTMQAMQGGAQNRMNMKAVYISTAMQRIGEKMIWLMRETYRSDIPSVTITTPDGEEVDLQWNEDELPLEMWMTVDIAANQPGGQQAILDQSIKLKKEGIVDRKYCLDSSGIEGSEIIDKRMKEQESADIATSAFGRSLGVQVKAMQKKTRGPKAEA